MKLLDISVPLSDGMAAWPGSPGYRSEPLLSLEWSDTSNVTGIQMDLHAGTHVDAPRHVLKGGETVSDIPIHRYIGPCRVVEVPDRAPITWTDLENASIAADCERLLLRTRNSDQKWLGEDTEFNPDFAALAPDAAAWIIRRGIRLVGIDYMSIEPFDGDGTVHRTLLGAGVVILEGLRLGHVDPGGYELICFPVFLTGCEAAPVRAVLREMI